METTPLCTLPPLKLIAGVGDYEQGTACVMSAAVALWRLKRGEDMGDATDQLDCCCPVIRRLCIARNDGFWKSDKDRTAWGMALIPRLIDSRKDRTETARRAYRAADVAAREIVPLAMEAAKQNEWAEKLRAMPEVKDKASAENARALLKQADAAAAAAAHAAAASAAAAYAYADADAAADAAAAAHAAAASAAAAYAYADAAAAAAAAAYAAADAAAAAYAAARLKCWKPIEELIEELLAA
jgi:hypothetical protein